MRLHRNLLAVFAAALILLAGMAALFATGARAQDATPAPLGFELAPGVTAEDIVPVGGPALFRLQIGGGATFDANDASDPSIALVYGETGTVSFTVGAPVTIFRAGAAGKPGENVAAGTAFDVNPGDYLAAPGSTKAVITNKGTAPATLLVASITPPGAAGTATPTS